MSTIGILYAEMATTFNLCENIRINQEREEFESLRSEMRYYMRKEQERAKRSHCIRRKPQKRRRMTMIKRKRTIRKEKRR